MNAKIEQIKDELFNLSFEESGKALIQKFKQNFQHLKEFMSAIDKEIQGMVVFNQKDAHFPSIHSNSLVEEDAGKFQNFSSVQ